MRMHGGVERGDEGWLLRLDPEFVVQVLHQLPARREPPCELGEDLVLLVGARQSGIGARLAVGFTRVLIAREEPQSFVPDPNADIVVTVPLEGDVGEMPGARLMKSNIPDRRVGIDLRSSDPIRVPNPGSRASMREPPR